MGKVAVNDVQLPETNGEEAWDSSRAEGIGAVDPEGFKVSAVLG